MLNKPLISIIVPTFNYGNYIVETLKNVQNQDYKEIEIIIIDDGSTDNTKEIIAPYLDLDPRIKYHYQANAGLSAARNLGLEKAIGTYVQFLDSDDLISLAKLPLQIARFEQNKGLAISYTKAYYFPTESPNLLFPNLDLTDEEWMPKVSGKGYRLIVKLIQQNIMPVNSVLIKRSVFNSICFDTSLKSLEDWDVWLYLAFQNNEFEYLDDEAGYALVRVHPSSMSQNKERMFDYEINLRLRIEKYIRESKLLDVKEKKALNRINLRRNKKLLSLIIRHAGFFNLDKIKQLLQRTNFGLLFKAYLKALKNKIIHH